MAAQADLHREQREFTVFRLFLLAGRVTENQIDQEWMSLTVDERTRVAKEIHWVNYWNRKRASQSEIAVAFEPLEDAIVAGQQVDRLKGGRAYDAWKRVLSYTIAMCESLEYLVEVHSKMGPEWPSPKLAQKYLTGLVQNGWVEHGHMKTFAEQLGAPVSMKKPLYAPAGGEAQVEGHGRYETAQEFLSSALDEALFPGRWEGAEELGGGMTKVGLWLKLDEHGMITDRVARKDQAMDASHWESFSYWHGDPFNLNNRIPLEFYLQSMCFNTNGQSCIVEPRGWSQHRPSWTMRQYVAYAPYGDLANVETLTEQCDEDDQWVPEPAIWMIIESLARACESMEQASDAHGPETTIVHRDIKGHNVFLDVPDDKTFPFYPTPKLADFGLAFTTDPSDPANPIAYKQSGTEGFFAPEAYNYVYPLKNDKLLSHTNVWGIGTIAHNLMHAYLGRENLEQTNYLVGDLQKIQSMPVCRYYSEELRTLVKICMRYDPTDRFSAGFIRQEIRTTVEGQRHNTANPEKAKMFQWLHDSFAGKAQGKGLTNDYPLRTSRESYKLGSSCGLSAWQPKMQPAPFSFDLSAERIQNQQTPNQGPLTPGPTPGAPPAQGYTPHRPPQAEPATRPSRAYPTPAYPPVQAPATPGAKQPTAAVPHSDSFVPETPMPNALRPALRPVHAPSGSNDPSPFCLPATTYQTPGRRPQQQTPRPLQDLPQSPQGADPTPAPNARAQNVAFLDRQRRLREARAQRSPRDQGFKRRHMSVFAPAQRWEALSAAGVRKRSQQHASQPLHRLAQSLQMGNPSPTPLVRQKNTVFPHRQRYLGSAAPLLERERRAREREDAAPQQQKVAGFKRHRMSVFAPAPKEHEHLVGAPIPLARQQNAVSAARQQHLRTAATLLERQRREREREDARPRDWEGPRGHRMSVFGPARRVEVAKAPPPLARQQNVVSQARLRHLRSATARVKRQQFEREREDARLREDAARQEGGGSKRHRMSVFAPAQREGMVKAAGVRKKEGGKGGQGPQVTWARVGKGMRD